MPCALVPERQSVDSELPDDGVAEASGQEDDRPSETEAESETVAAGSKDAPGDEPGLVLGPGERSPRRGLRYAGAIASVTVLLLLAGCASAYGYDRSRLNRIAPDVSVGGVLVGGLTPPEATGELNAYVESVRARQLTLKAYDKAYSVTLAQLDVNTNVGDAVSGAVDATRDLGIVGRLKRWLGGGGGATALPLDFEPSQEAIEKKIVATIAGQVNTEPSEASVDETSGDVVFKPAGPGRELDAVAASKLVFDAAYASAMGEAVTEVVLPVKEIPPPQGQDLGHAILVRVSQQKLFHYNNAELQGEYDISTGTPQYPTPLGKFRVVEKILNPSWTNPAPNGWGSDMPAYIPPGPSNPLGTRALALNSPGILIHGTTHVDRLGSPASHGCVRMARADIEGMFPEIPAGTPVFIVR